MPFPTRYAIALGAFCAAALSVPAIAGEDDGEAELNCLPPVGVSGFAKPDKDRAELDAISRWISKVSENSAEFSRWHRAERVKLQCEKLGRSVRCAVLATPCAAPGIAKPAAQGEAAE